MSEVERNLGSYTDKELVRFALNKPDATPLELELAARVSERVDRTDRRQIDMFTERKPGE